MFGMVWGSNPRSQQKNMISELELITKFEQLLAEQSYMAQLYRQYGRVPYEQREKVKRMRRELKTLCAERRLAIIRERNQHKQEPKQQTLFT